MQGGARIETPAMPRKRRQRRRRQAGFTLVELLVVLIILGLIAAFAAPRVIKFVGGAKTDSAKIQIERLSGVLDLYRLQVGRYPNEDEGLDALMEQPADAPDCESAIHSSVSKVKWNLSFNAPEGVLASVANSSK